MSRANHVEYWIGAVSLQEGEPSVVHSYIVAVIIWKMPVLVTM